MASPTERHEGPRVARGVPDFLRAVHGIGHVLSPATARHRTVLLSVCGVALAACWLPIELADMQLLGVKLTAKAKSPAFYVTWALRLMLLWFAAKYAWFCWDDFLQWRYSATNGTPDSMRFVEFGMYFGHPPKANEHQAQRAIDGRMVSVKFEGPKVNGVSTEWQPRMVDRDGKYVQVSPPIGRRDPFRVLTVTYNAVRKRYWEHVALNVCIPAAVAVAAMASLLLYPPG